MNHPFGLASMRETSGVALDRSAGGTLSNGGVVRIVSEWPRPRSVEFYALQRGGLAPPGTNSGGVTLRSSLWEPVDFDLATKVTSFGPRKAETSWTTERPAVFLPAIVRGAARVSCRLRDFRAANQYYGGLRHSYGFYFP